MKAKRRWYELLLAGLVILLIPATGAVNKAFAYEYDQSEWEEVYDDDRSQNDGDGGNSFEEYSTALSSANKLTDLCKCDVYARAQAKNNSAVALRCSRPHLPTS